MTHRTLLTVAAVMSACLAAAQTQPQFDAASLKPGDSAFVPGVSVQMKGGPGTSDPGRITYTQFGFKALLMRAWDVQIDQLIGPAFTGRTGNDWYTITATMPPDTTKERFRLMLQNLLTERFQLKFHHETRDFPGYELVVSNGGPKLKPTVHDTDPEAPANPGFPKFDADGFIIMPPGPGQNFVIGHGAGRARFQAQTMAEFALGLSGFLNRGLGADPAAPNPRILDKTSLTGKYDFALAFDCPPCQGITPVMRAQAPLLAEHDAVAGAPAAAAQDPGSGLPNIFNALEKQLGLKLVKVKDVPVDMLVIDHAEKVPLGD